MGPGIGIFAPGVCDINPPGLCHEIPGAQWHPSGTSICSGKFLEQPQQNFSSLPDQQFVDPFLSRCPVISHVCPPPHLEHQHHPDRILQSIGVAILGFV